MAKILIIDDEPDIRKLLKELLSNEGHQIIEAENGDFLENLFTEHHFDLIITDIIMPGKEGIQIIRELKGKNPELKIVAISGGGHWGADVYLGMAEKIGADLSISKPFDLTEFKKSINLLCS